VKFIYIAGPIKAETSWQREKNIRNAEEETLGVLKLGAAAFCPHTQARFYDGEMPYEAWIACDLEVLKRCDAVYFIQGWQDSTGACKEHAFAEANDIPIFENFWQLKAWLEIVE
jgi:hypothetical protein